MAFRGKNRFSVFLHKRGWGPARAANQSPPTGLPYSTSIKMIIFTPNMPEMVVLNFNEHTAPSHVPSKHFSASSTNYWGQTGEFGHLSLDKCLPSRGTGGQPWWRTTHIQRDVGVVGALVAVPRDVGLVQWPQACRDHFRLDESVEVPANWLQLLQFQAVEQGEDVQPGLRRPNTHPKRSGGREGKECTLSIASK